jgi:hypothetical protein
MKATGALRAPFYLKAWNIRKGFPSRSGQNAKGRAQDAVPVRCWGGVAAGLKEAKATTLV